LEIANQTATTSRWCQTFSDLTILTSPLDSCHVLLACSNRSQQKVIEKLSRIEDAKIESETFFSFGNGSV